MNDVQELIRQRSREIWIPQSEPYTEVNTNSWFNLRESQKPGIEDEEEHEIHEHAPSSDSPGMVMRCKKVNMELDSIQQEIMMRWLYAYTHMYNKTIDLLKQRAEKPNWKHIRTYCLKSARDNLITGSQLPKFSRNTKIMAHSMDGAIKLACSNYKTALTNIRNSNIKHFRIRKWRFNRQQMVMDIEKTAFHGRDIVTLCPRIFGTIKFTYNKSPFNVSTINSECKILFDRIYDRFTLLVPEEIAITSQPVHQGCSAPRIIALDPGVRTFMTGISDTNTVELCRDCTSPGGRIKKIMQKMDRINDPAINVPRKKRIKIEQRCRRKITGLVDELHWKSAKYLTDNYDTILIGDLSAKRIVSNNLDHGISKMNKRIALALSFFKFRERLMFKCAQKSRTYVLVDEHYTSMLCSNCGACKKDLGSSHVYNCPSCMMTMGRDINGARNIYMKGT